MRYLSATTPATYDEWLEAHRFWGPDAVQVLYALEVLAEQGGTWAVGDDLLVAGTRGADPRGALRLLVFSGLAQHAGADTYVITPSGKALDAGRPTRGNGVQLHRRHTA